MCQQVIFQFLAKFTIFQTEWANILALFNRKPCGGACKTFAKKQRNFFKRTLIMAPMNKLATSYLCIALGASCWGLIGLPNRFLIAMGFTPVMLVAIRPAIAAALFFVILLITDRSALRIRLKDLWCFLGTGVLSLTLFNFCYTTAQTYMSLSAAVVLLYTSPFFVVLLSAVLFKERITPIKVAALILVMMGAVFASGLIGSNASFSLIGLLLGIMAGFGYALYSIFGRFAIQRGYGSHTISFYTFLFSAIASFALSATTPLPAIDITPSVVFWALFLGVICCLVPYILYTKGLEKVENGRASVIASLEVVVASCVSIVAFHEDISLLGIAGVVLVIAGIVLMNTAKQ